MVSLTSYPPRFGTLALTLKTLLTQSVRPDSVTLWIAHADRDALPADVLALQAEGLTIEFCDDLRSYKKIIPLLRRDSNAIVVTADDDVYYPVDWLEALTTAYDPAGRTVVCHRGHLIKLTPDGAPADYDSWEFNLDREVTSDLLFPTGVGGVLYPPGVFHRDVLDAERFTALCGHGDDIWLYFMARRNGATWRKVGRRRKFRAWLGSQDVALMISNRFNRENDIQIRNVVDWCGFSRDPAARNPLKV